MLSLFSAHAFASTNIVKNGSFETGLAPWSFLLSGAVTGTRYEDSSNRTAGQYGETFQIWKAASNCAYCAVLRQGGLALQAGQTVKVSFSAKASQPRRLEVGLQQANSPYTWYSLNSFIITTRFSTYSFTFTPAASDANTLLNFDMGDIASYVSLDNVSVQVSSNSNSAPPSQPAPAPAPVPAPAPTPTPTGSLAAPAGYSSAQLIFEEKFTATSLDQTKWNPYMGDDIYGRWGDLGLLAAPYSAMNCNSTCSDSFNIQYYDPYPYASGTNLTGESLVGGNGNLRLIAKPSAQFANLGYSYSSAAVTSFGKTYLPATGGYVQFRARMPDSRYGGWAGLWMLSANGPEIDLIESGYTSGSANPNQVIASNFHGAGASQVIRDTGVDLSADFHTYGVEYRPGQSIKLYLDGGLVASYTSGIPVGAKYQLLMDVEVAGPNAAGWHSVADPVNHAAPISLDVNDVQIFSLP